MTFDEFEDTARELFGFDAGEARDFAETLEAGGLFLEEADAGDREFWEVATEFIDPYVEDYYTETEDDDGELYPLDPSWPDDEYLEPDIEWEMTAESDEGYGEDT